MARWHSSTNVESDTEFQRLYNHFYRLRRNQKFRSAYYQFMQENKGNSNLTFADVLHYFYQKFKRLESSFSSKLLHTIKPDKPVWDTWIGKNTGIKIPVFYEKNKLDKAIERYERLTNWFDRYKTSEEGKNLLQKFEDYFPHSDVADIKKIDLVLWQIR